MSSHVLKLLPRGRRLRLFVLSLITSWVLLWIGIAPLVNAAPAPEPRTITLPGPPSWVWWFFSWRTTF